jgi:hypothetical protein
MLSPADQDASNTTMVSPDDAMNQYCNILTKSNVMKDADSVVVIL